MSDQQPTLNVHVGRRVKNTLDRPFHVVFFERVYAGAPRWWTGEWERHHRTPSGGNSYCLEREREVKKHFELSHNERCLFNHQVPYLLACTNFSCTLRTWSIVNFLAGTLAYVESEKDFANDDKFEAAERNDFSKRIKADLHRVALGKDVPVGKNLHMEKCPHCQRPKMVSGITPIRKKWVYVLHGSDGPLKPHTEIYLESPAQGDMYQDFRNGAFNPRRKQQYPGYFPIEKADGEVWQFFLSPVRLGPKAISMLSQSRKTDHNWADSALDAMDKEKTVIETGWDPTQQPWCTVDSRKFSPGQVKTPCEPVALVDPFSWVGQASDLDYLPIAAARQALLDNPDEQAKAFIAASLAPAKGEKQNEHNIEQTEPWDLKGQTVEVPPEYASSGNIAQAWVDRYKQALEYLEKETRFACSRVIFAVRFSQAHRIVELACQENTGDPGALAFGMIHWNHILREMLVCEPGKSFIAWLTKSRGAIDRIPQQTVSEKYKSDPRAKEIGPGLPAMILSYLTPLLLRESENFAEDFRRRLAEIEIEVPMDWATAILAPETVKPIADIAFSIPEKYLHHYIEHFPEELHVEQFHAFNGAQSWKARIMGLSKLKDLLRVAALLRCVFEFGQEYKGPDTGWGHFGHVVEKIETPVKIAEFGVEQAKLLIEAGYAEELEEVAEHIARHGAKGIYGELYAKKLLKATNALKAMKVLEAGEKILSGPVGFLMGGFEVMLQEHESVEAMENGDLNAAMAHHIKAIAGGLVAVVGALETLALFGLIAEMAWLGPVGWIAAGLMLLGEIYLAYGKKTDYQLFAARCFLGKEAGSGGEEKTSVVWMGDMSWEQLAEPRYGRLALLRLVSTFSVWIGWYPQQYEGPWWQIKAKFVPTGAYFEVEEEIWNLPLKPDRVTQKAKIWADGKLEMEDSTNCAVQVSHHRDGTVFAVKITPDSQYPKSTNWDDIKYEWGVRVRLVLDGKNTLPAKGWVENRHGTISSEVGTSAE